MTHRERYENFVETRADARLAAIAWIVTLIWTVGVSWWLSRETPPPLIWGIPRWVVFGVFLPWVGTAAFNVWYSTVYLVRKQPARGSH